MTTLKLLARHGILQIGMAGVAVLLAGILVAIV